MFYEYFHRDKIEIKNNKRYRQINQNDSNKTRFCCKTTSQKNT